MNLSTAEKILFSAFKSSGRLSQQDIPGHYSVTVADLEGKGLIAPVKGKAFTWEITPKGRKFDPYAGNPPRGKTTYPPIEYTEGNNPLAVYEERKTEKGLRVSFYLKRSLRDYEEAKAILEMLYPGFKVREFYGKTMKGQYGALLREKQEKKNPPFRRFVGRKWVTEYAKGTWIEPEEVAYPSGGMKRHAKVIDEHDNLLKFAFAGIADTFFTIPAYIMENRKRIKGFIHIQENALYFVRSTKSAEKENPPDDPAFHPKYGQFVESYMGVNIYFLHTSYSAPALSLYGYARDISLKRAIQRELKKRGKKNPCSEDSPGLHNPPLPASALLDLGVARSLVREVYEDMHKAYTEADPHVRKLERAIFMLQGAMDRLEMSHRGQVDFSNPPESTEVYRNILEIRAKKKNGLKYVHKFKPGSRVFGLPDGSILVKNDKGLPLWKNFPKGAKS
jgi:hypothetical protein